MTLGMAPRQGDLLDDITRFCDATLRADSIYAFLHRERDRLFPDEFFADLFADQGRRSVPPSVVATVMVLQRLEGLSDREAVERFTFDARWRYAAGVGGYDGEGRWSFVHTVSSGEAACSSGRRDQRDGVSPWPWERARVVEPGRDRFRQLHPTGPGSPLTKPSSPLAAWTAIVARAGARRCIEWLLALR
jgi:Transposase domain (DUF772)